MKWPGSRAALVFFLLGIMIPVHAVLIPVYIQLQSLRDFIDARIVVMIPYAAFGLSTSILIFSGYFHTLAKEVEEAAVMDGYSIIGTFFKIIVPLSPPVIATVSILSFIHSWNELLFGLVFLKQPGMQTIPVALLQFKGMYSTNWSTMLAAITMTTVPSVIVYMLLQDKIVQGITDGAVKS